LVVKNGSKIRVSTSGAIPVPESDTVSATYRLSVASAAIKKRAT